MKKLIFAAALCLSGCTALSTISDLLPSGQSGGTHVETDVEISKGKSEVGLQNNETMQAETITISNQGVHPMWLLIGVGVFGAGCFFIAYHLPRPKYAKRMSNAEELITKVLHDGRFGQ